MNPEQQHFNPAEVEPGELVEQMQLDSSDWTDTIKKAAGMSETATNFIDPEVRAYLNTLISKTAQEAMEQTIGTESEV